MSLIRLSGEESLNSVRRRSRQLQDLFGLERLSCHRQQHVALPALAWQASVLFYSNDRSERR